MSRWRTAVFVVLGCLVLLPGFSPASADLLFPDQNTASESYYHLRVEDGEIDVRVDMLAQPASGALDEVWVWLMPGAKEITVTQGDTTLEYEYEGVEDGLGVMSVALPATLKGKLTAEFELRYVVGTQDIPEFSIKPGAIESLFVSQGAGSFVLIDVPQHGENVVDSGCILGASQPGSVKEEGYERWVCGEPIVAALSADNPDVLERCAKMSDSCRQRVLDFPISAWAQSVTDPSLQGRLKTTIELGRGPVELELKYFKSDAAWAQKQFDVSLAALPKLEGLFGWEYPWEIALLRQSNQIEFVGAAGVAFPTEGEMLIAANTGFDFDEEVTVHELAHQWAGYNLEQKWVWEGLAEYATTVLAPELGFTMYDRAWDSYGYDDPLATWYNGSSVTNPDYWYGKAGAFWFAFETEIGGRDNMKAVLSMMDDDPAALPLDDRWFMDRGEEVSGANLDALFLEWVWVPDYAQRQLADRRAAHDLVKSLKERALAAGLVGVPTDIQNSLDAWSFSSVDDRVKRTDKVITEYLDVLSKQAAAGLTPSSAVPDAWSESSITRIEQLIDQQRSVIDSILGAARTVADEPEDSPAWKNLADAKAAYAEGDFGEASRLASEAGAVVYNEVASIRMIAVAEATGEAFEENFFKRIGMFWENPEGDLAAAKAASEAGDDETALRLAKAAYGSWNGAQTRGFQRLAMLAGLMSAITFGGWWLLGRFGGGEKDEINIQRARDAAAGVPATETRRNWRDWENSN